VNGWVCPKCNRVWAPFVEQCRGCNGMHTVIADKVQEQKRKKSELQEIEKQVEQNGLLEQVDPFGPGRMAPNAQYDPSRHPGFDNPRWGGKTVTILQPKLDPSIYQQPGQAGGSIPEQQPGFYRK
jgi:hypothetical protein